MIHKRIKELRTTANLSQEELANAIGISRVAISQIELWERSIKTEELKRFSEVFEISTDDLIKSEKKKKIHILSKEKDQLYKFKQVFLYILNKCAQKPNVWKTVLNKLLYFSDFNYFEKYMESITWVEYAKLPKWPAPKIMDTILPIMEQEQIIRQIEVPYFHYTQQKIIPLVTPDMNVLSAIEIAEIDAVINNYSDKSADRLSERSHNDMPYKATKNIWDTISYGLVTYRDSLYSVSERKDAD